MPSCCCKSKCRTSRCPCKAAKLGCSATCSCAASCLNKAAQTAALASSSTSATEMRHCTINFLCNLGACKQCKVSYMQLLLTCNLGFDGVHADEYGQCDAAIRELPSTRFSRRASSSGRRSQCVRSWSTSRVTSSHCAQLLQVWKLLYSICRLGETLLSTGSRSVFYGNATLSSCRVRQRSCQNSCQLGAPHGAGPLLVL